VIRLVASAVVSLIANAVALVVAAQVLDDMSLDVTGFVIAVALFTVVGVLTEPLLRQTALRNAPALLGSSALLATLISLVVTVAISDGLQISGLTTWVLAAVIVWAVALAGRLLLPFIIFKRVLSNAADGRRLA
jgi:putative membrane protein